MKILYIATSFPAPEQGATIYTDLAEALHEAGHEIVVAVSEQPKNLQTTSIRSERGFEVLRIVTGNYYDVGYIEKGITTLKIPVMMRRGIRKYLGGRTFDFVLYEAPPVTNAGLVTWAKRRFSCASYLMLKDIFPQNAVDLGIMKRGGLLFRYFKHKEKKLFESADIIGCMSSANVKYVLEHNQQLGPEKVEIFPNTKKLASDYRPTGFPMRKKFGISPSDCLFLFGGNMGKPQYIELLRRLILDCKEDADLYFLFVGRGTDRSMLENAITEHTVHNAKIIGNLPRDEYEQLIKECDVGLIVLDPRFTIPNYPSRILSYMEYAKPVLAATDRVSDIRQLIEDAQCGQWVWSGDYSAFAVTIRQMAKMSNLPDLGYNGRRFIEENLTMQTSVGILEKHFQTERK